MKKDSEKNFGQVYVVHQKKLKHLSIEAGENYTIISRIIVKGDS
jgi:hypothetical protein